MNRLLLLLVLLSLAGIAHGDEGTSESSREAAQARLTPLQDFVGDWKGVGQRQRGKSEGGWIENSSWAWKFDGQAATITFTSADARYLASGQLTPGKKPGEYVLQIATPDGKTKGTYRGKLDDGKLIVSGDEPVEGLPERITWRLLAGGKRLVALYETRLGSSDRFARMAEVGYTRVGSGFGQGSQGPECVVTGGFGTIEVRYDGKTYYVCCTGCKDYFDENPKEVIEEYLARKAAEREKQK